MRPESLDDDFDDEELDDEERRDRGLLARTGTTQAARCLRDLGVKLIYRLTDEPSDGEVIVGEASQAGSTSPEAVVNLVQLHASRDDNIRKLAAAADRAERHLFVWVESSQHAAVAALGMASAVGALPDAPRLPACVDAVWVVTAFDSAHAWRYDRGAGWRDFGSITVEEVTEP